MILQVRGGAKPPPSNPPMEVYLCTKNSETFKCTYFRINILFCVGVVSCFSVLHNSPRPREEITLGQLQGKVCNPPVILNIRRGDVMNDALSEAKKQKFCIGKHIKVFVHSSCIPHIIVCYALFIREVY